MPTNSSTETLAFLKGQVVIHSSTELDALAEQVGTALGGVEFGGRDEQICEEVPAVYADVLGLRLVLQGFPHEHYVLDCYPAPSLPVFGDDVLEVDVSEHLLRTIGNLPEASLSVD